MQTCEIGDVFDAQQLRQVGVIVRFDSETTKNELLTFRQLHERPKQRVVHLGIAVLNGHRIFLL